MERKRSALLAAALLLLAACGQSGPLYLPGNPSRIQVENPDAESGTDEVIEDEEQDKTE